MAIAKKIEEFLSKSSWIRKMFEEGAKLSSIHGRENVYDFSLGNPNVSPPNEFRQILSEISLSSKKEDHCYMSNSGYLFVRESVANYLSKEHEIAISEKEIIMTCGAAGALNVILKTILDPGDEVIGLIPYFVEYGFYVDNHGGILKTVPTKEDFSIDIEAISKSINQNTKAIIINSPNNPTGKIYSEENILLLGNILEQKGKELNKTIYLISDEPYRKIVYDGVKVPSIFKCYTESIIANSYSKDLSIPGERIGFIAVHPKSLLKDKLLDGMTLANRILGFVNAPAFMQRVIAKICGITVDVSEYTRKRDLICNILTDCGYEFVKPQGAFYVFPKTPIQDDVEFVKALQEERILTVPGRGFGAPNHFRIAFCVDDKTITSSASGFDKIIKKYK
ncbi:MAG: pyridoxal phosphate-dependent aminotransferase [Desulfobacterales bacterium]|nr:pyridoxal phosphate-dependent aminotransferase [Desulfobacterales bacterium]